MGHKKVYDGVFRAFKRIIQAPTHIGQRYKVHFVNGTLPPSNRSRPVPAYFSGHRFLGNFDKKGNYKPATPENRLRYQNHQEQMKRSWYRTYSLLDVEGMRIGQDDSSYTVKANSHPSVPSSTAHWESCRHQFEGSGGACWSAEPGGTKNQSKGSEEGSFKPPEANPSVSCLVEQTTQVACTDPRFIAAPPPYLQPLLRSLATTTVVKSCFTISEGLFKGGLPWILAGKVFNSRIELDSHGFTPVMKLSSKAIDSGAITATIPPPMLTTPLYLSRKRSKHNRPSRNSAGSTTPPSNSGHRSSGEHRGPKKNRPDFLETLRRVLSSSAMRLCRFILSFAESVFYKLSDLWSTLAANWLHGFLLAALYNVLTEGFESFKNARDVGEARQATRLDPTPPIESQRTNAIAPTSTVENTSVRPTSTVEPTPTPPTSAVETEPTSTLPTSTVEPEPTSTLPTSTVEPEPTSTLPTSNDEPPITPWVWTSWLE